MEHAKNKKLSSTEDAEAYTAMFAEWKSDKGNAKLKKEKAKGVREIYKRVLYKNMYMWNNEMIYGYEDLIIFLI